MFKRSTVFLLLNLVSASAFAPVIPKTQTVKNVVVYSSNDINDPDSTDSISPPPSYEEYTKAREEVPEPVQVSAAASIPQQPPVPPKRLDPLMASLTRMDADTANGPTRKLPLFGEVPVDGSMTVLLPAAGIAVLGFIFSIVVAFNSQDEFVQIITQATTDISDKAAQQPNMVYDENVCRGLCSSQASDLEGMRNFMQSLAK